MRSRLALLCATAMAITGAVVPSRPIPASATQLCAGTGTMVVGPGLLYPAFFFGSAPTTASVGEGNVLHSFSAWFGNPGACAHVPSGTFAKVITAAGTIKGHCGFSVARGVSDNGALFAWVEVGTALVVTGHFVGTGKMQPDIAWGESCAASDGALRFFVTLTGLLQTCSALPATTEVLPPLPPVYTSVPGGSVYVSVGLGVHAFVDQPCSDPDVLLP